MDDAPLTSDPGVGAWKLRLRPELKSSLRSNQGKPFVLVQDGLRSQFYRLGVHEWRIARMLDGNRTLRLVIHDVARRPRRSAARSFRRPKRRSRLPRRASDAGSSATSTCSTPCARYST